MPFNPVTFIEKGTYEEFDQLKKAQLQVLAEHVGLKINAGERKQIFKNKLIDCLVKAKKFDVEILDKKVEIQELHMSEMEMKLQVQLKQMEHEHEAKMKELENQNTIQMKQLEVKLKELEKDKN